MKEKIEMILQDIYQVSPELKAKEAQLKKVIQEMLSYKPDADMDEQFRAELRDKLLLAFEAKKKRKGLGIVLLMMRSRVLQWSGGALALVVAAVIVTNYTFVKPVKQETIVMQEKQSLPESQVEPIRKDLSKSETKAKDKYEAPPVNTGKSDDLTSTGIPIIEREENEKGLADTRSDRPSKEAVAGAPEAKSFNRAKKAAQEPQDFNTESYDRINENDFQNVIQAPLSTLSFDVDTASYANIRRFINNGSLPYPDAVRIEEMVNYFKYDYEGPKGNLPLAFQPELSVCPWNKKHLLLRIGTQAKKIETEALPPNNLVFLLDVSGSMQDENKLPLVKSAMKLLVNEMRPIDRISLVVYAGSAGLVLPSTSGKEKKKIIAAIDNLEAGGSTAGGEGIELAYETARKAFITGGNNRVILATDGDFNVGASSDGEMVRLIESKRKLGIFLTVLGVGMGNYKDSKMVQLADKGNGNYAYIDSFAEAKKVLVSQLAGTLYTIAKDVKLQIEFNPAKVQEYRLVGYEKRVLAAKDFQDDKKDAGELGSGHSVTFLYEIIPAEGQGTYTPEELKYQKNAVKSDETSSAEWLTLKFRYKKLDSDKSSLLEYPLVLNTIALDETSDDYRFAAAVAEWGMLLRNSEFKASANYGQVLALAENALGADKEGYRREFVSLVKKAQVLMKK